MSHEDVRELLRLECDPAEYRAIRDEWKRHSIAEDNRDIPGLMATLTPDCVYEVPQVGARWEGHAGATRFYKDLLGAFPDVRFDLQYIVIGPQGVCEEARVSGTHERDWLQFAATGRLVEFHVVIFFPWDRERKKFLGERVYFDIGELQS